MYGDPDTSSAYSLCGDVVLSLRPQWSLLGRQPGGSVRIAVSSIALTFEGQCEVVSPRHGYSATRLCSIIKELVPSPAPIELETELGTQECGADFNAAFSLPVPGWLPATTQLGYNSDFGVKYTLFVDVSYYTLSEEGASASSGLSFLRFCSPFFTRTRFAAAETGVVLRRFMTEATPRLRTFNIPPVIPAVADVSTSALDDLASKIQVFATLPECVSTQASSFPCSLRISAKQLDMADREKLKITMLNMNVFQVEKCRYAPSIDYRTHYPLPHEAHQPPFLPLRRPHNISLMTEIGMGSPYVLDASTSRTISLLPENVSSRTLLNEHLHFLHENADESNTTSGVVPGDASYVIEAVIPFSSIGRTSAPSSKEAFDQDQWAGPMNLRPSAAMPLYTVRHELEVALQCTYAGEEGEKWVYFVVPVKFAAPAPEACELVDDRDADIASGEEEDGADDENAPLIGFPISSPSPRIVAAPTMAQRQPRAVALPAYSQLFHTNGDRRIDYSVPLPLYTPFDELKGPVKYKDL